MIDALVCSASIVLDFDQQMGAAHCIHWSKYCYSLFLTILTTELVEILFFAISPVDLSLFCMFLLHIDAKKVGKGNFPNTPITGSHPIAGLAPCV